MSSNKKKLSSSLKEELLNTLKTRFEKNMNRHNGIEWTKIQAKMEAQPEKVWSLNEMERTGGEPDVIGLDKKTGEYIFYDCSAEVLKTAEAFATTARPWSQEKKINRQAALWIWQQLWALSF